MIVDFNSIRRSGERRNVGNDANYSREVRWFNDFIENTYLIDNPITLRKFTWYKPNELIKSKIHQILVLRERLEKWHNSKQFVLGRSVSYALVLKNVIMNWGLKLLRSLDI